MPAGRRERVGARAGAPVVPDAPADRQRGARADGEQGAGQEPAAANGGRGAHGRIITPSTMANRASRGEVGRGDTPGAGGVPDSLFPQPDSPGGRLLGRLVSLQVPGAPGGDRPLRAGAVRAPGSGCRRQRPLRLAADGLVQLETEPESEQLVVTVMLAPPEDFGITPDWGEAAGPGPIAGRRAVRHARQRAVAGRSARRRSPSRDPAAS